MLGVLPEIRARGVGAALKWKQREEALKQGLELMTWTYDPLQAVNAQLNLTRLGAIARRYYRDAYGEMTDALNIGVASDRFEVEWFLTSPHVLEAKKRSASMPPASDAQFIYTIEWDPSGFPVIRAEAAPRSPTILVEIPPDINSLKQANLAAGREWRMRTRVTFERAFKLGYAASGLVRLNESQARPRTLYALSQGRWEP
jgi:predicted GNAT superfamily acetyltransferase